MLTSEDKDRIAMEIGNLFEGLEVGEVAEIMTIQLAMLAAQGAEDLDDALEFLDEIRNDAESILEDVDFGQPNEAEEKTDRPD